MPVPFSCKVHLATAQECRDSVFNVTESDILNLTWSHSCSVITIYFMTLSMNCSQANLKFPGDLKSLTDESLRKGKVWIFCVTASIGFQWCLLLQGLIAVNQQEFTKLLTATVFFCVFFFMLFCFVYANVCLHAMVLDCKHFSLIGNISIQRSE